MWQATLINLYTTHFYTNYPKQILGRGPLCYDLRKYLNLIKKNSDFVQYYVYKQELFCKNISDPDRVTRFSFK